MGAFPFNVMSYPKRPGFIRLADLNPRVGDRFYTKTGERVDIQALEKSKWFGRSYVNYFVKFTGRDGLSIYLTCNGTQRVRRVA